MANKYPDVTIHGLDLIPTPFDRETLPLNVHFTVHDINNGLQDFHNQFDVVHAQYLSSRIKSYRSMMEDAEKCLKPGGVVIFIDFDLFHSAENQLTRMKVAEAPGVEDGQGSWLIRTAHGE